MGYFRALETDVLHLPSNPEFWVKMKRKATYGDSRAAQTALLKVSSSTANGNVNGNVATEIEVGSYIGELTRSMIVEWNITDETGNIAPISIANLDRLEDIDGEFLATEAQNRKGERPREEQVPFPKPSGHSSTAIKSITGKRTDK